MRARTTNATKKTTSKKTSSNTAAKKSASSRKMNSSMHEVFVTELKDIYWAEKHLVKSLPKMMKAATSKELKAAFEDHIEVTEKQVERLEEVFGILDMKPQAKKCEAMDGLVKEGKEMIEEMEKGMGLDAALISAAQKVEHYEIASYGCLRTFARVLGLSEAANLLQETLDEEGETDKLLTSIAEGFVNEEASEEEEE